MIAEREQEACIGLGPEGMAWFVAPLIDLGRK
jgi:hypothetical protein